VRELPTIRQILQQSDNKYVGVNKPHGRVTVEPAWQLNTTGQVYGNLDGGPYRYWAYGDQSQVELEVPNIDSISINRSLDQEAATCTIIMSNQVHDDNDETPSTLDFGNPGYYGFGYGDAPDSLHLWAHQENSWNNVLVPNALIRTYQGYGGYTVDGNGQLQQDSISTAVASGNLTITGVWLIDTVQLGTNGKIQLQCRDMAKLLIEQLIYPPLVPDRFYPPKWCRYVYESVPANPLNEGVTEDEPLVLGPASLQYEDSSVARWLGASSDLGSQAKNAFSINETEVSIGHGWRYWEYDYAKDWWQATCNTEINEIYINLAGTPHGGGYFVYISVMEDGVWQGVSTIPYSGDDPGSNIQIYHPDKPSLNTGINFVTATGIEPTPNVNEDLKDGTWVKLPRVYDAERIRITVESTWDSPWGPNTYRSAVGAIRARLANIDVNTETPTVATEFETIQRDGNITDWLDPVKELLLWGGFLLYNGEEPSGEQGVYGILETSGTWPVECLNENLFDKKSIMDSLISIKEVLGYLFFIDEEGAVHFHSPNWWSSGNTNQNGIRVNYVHDIADDNTMTDYTANYTDANTRSEIVIDSSLVDDEAGETQHVSFDPRAVQAPDSPDLLRGMVKPAVWTNEVWTNEDEQRLMAALIGLHSMFNSRQGSVTIVANPEIQINDQVRITERVTSESWVHYVRSIQSDMNLETGEYTMTVGTNWLGESENWAFDRNTLLAFYNRQSQPRQTGYDNGYEAWRAFQEGRSQDLRIPTVVTEPSVTHGEGGTWNVGVVVGSDPGTGVSAAEIADTDVLAFMDQATQYSLTSVNYIFSTPTVPTGYDVLVVTSEANNSDINSWGSFALISTPVIHARPANWDNNEISGVGASSANSSTIDAQINGAFQITGAPGTVPFGDGGTVTTSAVASGNLPTGTISVGESGGGDIVIGAIPAGETYDDSNDSTVRHVIWGSDVADVDLYDSVAWEAMGDAILWTKGV